MIQSNANINSPVRQIISKVELYNSSTITKKGGVIAVEDVNPKAREAELKLIGLTDFANITITAYGRNIFNINRYAFPKQTINGITFEQVMDKIHIYGQAIDASNYTAAFCNMADYDERYNLPIGVYSNSEVKVNGKRVYFQAQIMRQDGTWVQNIGQKNVTTTEAGNLRRYSVVVSKNITEEIDMYLPLQISVGSQCLEYEPYKGTTYNLDVDGTVINFTAKSPNMTIIPSISGYGIEAQLTYKALVLDKTYSYNDVLQEVSVDRVGENSKFFGFGITQKARIKIREGEKPSTSQALKIYYGTINDGYIDTHSPLFYVTETHRDEVTGALTITSYDMLKDAEKPKLNNLATDFESFYLYNFVRMVAEKLGLEVEVPIDESNKGFNTYYEWNINFEGTETLKETLTYLAEVTQTIYFIKDNKIIFKRLDRDGAAVYTIGKADYFELKSGDNRRLATIFHNTQLGDNFGATTGATGTTQIVWDNPLWELREDVESRVNIAIELIGNITINQFDCNWRGNFLLEIGDKIDLITKENTTVSSYVLNDTITYNGALSQNTKWEYQNTEDEEETAPTTVGDAIKYTYAKVDRVNREITLVTSELGANTDKISAIEQNTESISLSVEEANRYTEEILNNLTNELVEISSKASLAVTKEDITMAIEKAVTDGEITKVVSTSGTFDENGLTIAKTDSIMTTNINEDGMKVYKSGEEVLVANNEGVVAYNLKSKNYFTIGNTSRLEDYDNNMRTACYWIGGY